MSEEFSFTINKQYAENYERKKRVEELSKLQDKYAQEEEFSTDSESLEEEDEEGDLVTPEVDAKILETISIIRAKDENIYKPEKVFFSEKDFEGVEEKKVKAKPFTIQDFQRKKLLDGFHEKEELVESHHEEQEKLKRDMKKAFLEQDDHDDDDEMFMKKRVKSKDDEEKEEDDYKEFLLKNLSKNTSSRETMTEWFSMNGKEEKNLDEDEKFLMEYLLNKGWVEKTKKTASFDFSNEHEDEEIVEKAEEFEQKLNFRFEQEGANAVKTHARVIEDSVRRKDDSRKAAREAKAARKEEEKLKKQEELKRLKKLKSAEIKEKLMKLKAVANTDDSKIEKIDLDEDFDPEKYDTQMAQVFDEDYYKEDEGKPVFDDDLSDLESDAKLKIKSKAKVHKVDPTKVTEDVEKIMDEYYQLDYEDMIDNIPCRFKYRKVASTTYGLTLDDILAADDKKLNEFVSLKKLAPYRPPEKEQADIQKYSKKKRLRKFYEDQKEGEKSNIKMNDKKSIKKQEKSQDKIEEKGEDKKREKKREKKE